MTSHDKILEKWRRQEVPFYVHYLPPKARDVYDTGFGLIEVEIIEARGLLTNERDSLIIHSFCTLEMDGQEAKSKMTGWSNYPVWNEKFEFRVRNPDQKMQIDLYTDPKMGKRIHLGKVVFELSNMLKEQTGWYQVRDQPGFAIEAAGIKIRVKKTIFSEELMTWAFLLRPEVKDATQEEVYDIEVVYSSIMTLWDIWWNRFGFYISDRFWVIVLWSDWWLSAQAYVIFLIAVSYPWVVPSITFFLVASYQTMRYFERFGLLPIDEDACKKVRRWRFKLRRKPVHVSKDEQQKLGKLLSGAASMIPRWLKVLLHGMQPALRNSAETSQWINRLITWQDYFSKYVSMVLWISAVLSFFFPKFVLWIYGTLIFILFTPIFVAIQGYFLLMWARKPTGKISESYDIHA